MLIPSFKYLRSILEEYHMLVNQSGCSSFAPLVSSFQAFPSGAPTSEYITLMSTPSLRDNDWHTYAFSTFLYCIRKTLSLPLWYHSRKFTCLWVPKGHPIGFGTVLFQTNHGCHLSGCVPRDWKLRSPPISRGPGHPSLTLTIRGQDLISILLVLGNTGILLTHKGKREKEERFRFPWRAFKRWWT